jgi:hypothetical protein
VSYVLLIIGLLLTLLLVLLAMPITVAFRIDRVKEIKGQVSFRWLFGLVRFRIGIPGDKKHAKRFKRKRVKKTGKRRKGGNARSVIRVLKQSAFRRRAIRFFKYVLRATHATDLYFRLRIGLGDPADTGRIWALFGPVAGFASNIRSAEVRIEPEFIEPVLEVESHGEFSLIPLQFIALTVLFVVSPMTIRAFRTLRQGVA